MLECYTLIYYLFLKLIIWLNNPHILIHLIFVCIILYKSFCNFRSESHGDTKYPRSCVNSARWSLTSHLSFPCLLPPLLHLLFFVRSQTVQSRWGRRKERGVVGGNGEEVYESCCRGREGCRDTKLGNRQDVKTLEGNLFSPLSLSSLLFFLHFFYPPFSFQHLTTNH